MFAHYLFRLKRIMRKFTFKAFIITTCLLSISLVAKSQYILTYSDGNIANGSGQSYGTETYDLSAAMYLNANKLRPVKGNKITKIVVGISNPSVHPVTSYGDLTVFVKDELENGKTLSSQTLPKSQIVLNAWNEVELSVPVEITDQPLYVGYTISDANRLPIGYDGNTTLENENANYFASNGVWEVNKGFGNFCIKAIVTGDNVPQYNATFTHLMPPSLVKKDNVFSMVGNLLNKAALPITSIEVVCKRNGSVVESATAEGLNIEYDKSGLVIIEGLKWSEIGDDMDVELSVLKVNGENLNAADEDNKIDFSLTCSENCVPRKILLEHFTSLPCSGCPAGMERLYTAIGDSLDRIAWVSHHNGAFTDNYTIDESYAFVDFYGVDSNTAPSAMFDRVNWKQLGAMIPSASTTLPSVGPVFTISYAAAVDVMKNILKVRLSDYSPISISSIDQKYLEPGVLTITVKGKRLRTLGGMPAVSVFLTEDGLPGTGSHGNQDHVARYVANSSKYYYWGDPITFDSDGSFSASFDVNLVGRNWNLANVKVIAMVSNLDLQDINNNNVYNAEQVSLYDDGSGIEANLYENSLLVHGQDGQIVVEGEYSSLEVYTTDGRRVENRALTAGIYVVKVMSNHQVITRKIQL